MFGISQDLRVALRGLWRRRLVSLSIITTLALGIGANAAIFSSVSAVFLQPLPFADEDRLLRIYITPQGEDIHLSPRPAVFDLIRDHAESFDRVVAQRFMDLTVETSEGPERVTGIGVSPGWARTLGVTLAIGRPFTEQEERGGESAGAALISYRSWQSRFGGDPEILGRSVTIEQRPYSIVGVLSPGFHYPYHADFWLPMDLTESASTTWGLNIQVRMVPDVTLEQARAELTALSSRLPEAAGQSNMVFLAIPIREVLLEDKGRILVALLVAGGFLLLIVCTNIANLLLAQSISRRQEHAVRSALGASFGSHLRLALSETLLLAALGCTLGIFLARSSTSLLAVLIPSDLTYVVQGLAVDYRTVLYSLALALLAAVFTAVVPARRASRRDPAGELLEGSTRSTGAGRTLRLGRAMVVAEIALALVLMAGAGVMIQDLQRQVGLDLGYDPVGLQTLNITLAQERYAEGSGRVQLVDRSIEAIRALPGVTDAGVGNIFPADGQGNLVARIAVEGTEATPDTPELVNYRLVTPGYLDAIGLPLMRGRVFSSDDRDGSQLVAVINQSAASRHFPGVDPVGRRIQASRGDTEAEWLVVVGVVGDNLEFYDVEDTVFVPYTQHANTRHASQAVFVVRSEGSTESLLPAIRSAIWSLDPHLAIFDTATAEDLYAAGLMGAKSASLLTGLLATIGLIVAVVGVYAAMAFSIGQRNREVAIRMSLGGRRGRVLADLLVEAGRTLAAGIGCGIIGALVLNRVLASVLSEVEVQQTTLLAAISITLAAAALLAAYLPARRAVRSDPAEVLRGA
ncbi:MAG: ABC transporter permease [bacterium]|nr:ABC transporter permease [bacterium]